MQERTQTPNKKPTIIKKLRIGIVAGEASGDTLGANLMTDLNLLRPNISWVGVGGLQMKNAGMNSLFDIDRLSVMGLVEVLKHLPDLFKAKKELVEFLLNENIDIFIGIDAPDFNLRIAKILKENNIHTIQYVSPSIWAWREKRIHKIMLATKQVLCLFPFELPVYKKYQHPAICVGHPLIKQVKKTADMLDTRINLIWQQAPLKKKFVDREITALVGLLPGSRISEIQRIAPTLFSSAQVMLEINPTLNFFVPILNFKQQKTLETILRQYPNKVQEAITILIDTQTQHFSHTVMSACNIVIAASGTVTLEAMLLEKPMVVVYKLNPISYALAKRMIKTPFVALPNIIAGREIVPELIQDKATPERVALYALNLLIAENAELQRKNLQQTAYKLRHQDVESASSAVLAGYF